MPIIKPLKDNPDKHNVEYDYRELEKLYQEARDVYRFSHIVKVYAGSNEHRGFWDDDLEAISRIYSKMVHPFSDFFSTVINAAGEIAIDREHDPSQSEPEPPGTIITLVRTQTKEKL
jgi:hypothetical protein